ncbi:MAG: (4Fe-4S)-binding protein [Methanothrix sp.]|jgi:uncharacterized Fe-S cluster protein YjdI|nr:(4Fe-4S)-binding protein [Methanothrix sp.]
MREYSNGEIVVCWDPAKCIHARECVKGLPQVFNREKRPWVNMQGASSAKIMSVIDRCPSGALSYKKVEDAGKPAARIKVVKNGPLLVEGSCALVDQDGKEAASCGPFALCRCTGSKNKPFCDGTHIQIGFDDRK